MFSCSCNGIQLDSAVTFLSFPGNRSACLLLILSGNILCYVYELSRSCVQPYVWVRKPLVLSGLSELGIGYKCAGIRYGHLNINRNRHRIGRRFLINSAEGSGSTDSGRNVEDDEIMVKSGTGGVASRDFKGKLQEMIYSSPPGVFLVSFWLIRSLWLFLPFRFLYFREWRLQGLSSFCYVHNLNLFPQFN